jgi:hypothetical protein
VIVIAMRNGLASACVPLRRVACVAGDFLLARACWSRAGRRRCAQASVRSEVFASLDPVRRLPQMLAAALPVVDVAALPAGGSRGVQVRPAAGACTLCLSAGAACVGPVGMPAPDGSICPMPILPTCIAPSALWQPAGRACGDGEGGGGQDSLNACPVQGSFEIPPRDPKAALVMRPGARSGLSVCLSVCAHLHPERARAGEPVGLGAPAAQGLGRRGGPQGCAARRGRTGVMQASWSRAIAANW